MVDENMPVRTAALRVGALICAVVLLDAAAAAYLVHPRIWCGAIIPSLMLLAPFTLYRWKKR